MIEKKIVIREDSQGGKQKVILEIRSPSGRRDIELPYAWQPGMFNQISELLLQDDGQLAYVSRRVNKFGTIEIQVEFTNRAFGQDEEIQHYD